MKTLNIPATEDTPEIILNSAGDFQFNGKSLPEDVVSFYNPVLDWISKYGENPNSTSIFKFNFTYFNNESSKTILDILMKLEELSENGANVQAEWHYNENDENMEEHGEEFAKVIEVPFNLIPYKA